MLIKGISPLCSNRSNIISLGDSGIKTCLLYATCTSMENWAHIAEPKFCQMSKKINKFHFSSVRSVAMREISLFSYWNSNKQMKNVINWSFCSWGSEISAKFSILALVLSTLHSHKMDYFREMKTSLTSN